MALYSPERVLVTLSNPAKGIALSLAGTLAGFADGSFVEAKRAEKAFKQKPGIGRATRVKTGRYDGEITLTLMKESEFNGAFSSIVALDERGADQVFQIKIQDLSGVQTFAMSEGIDAGFAGPADLKSSNDADDIAWTILVPKLIIYQAGHVRAV